MTASLWDEVAEGARRESPLWAAALRPEEERELEPVFSPLGDERRALGVETIYEGYLLHYGKPRLFAPPAPEDALLLGDYLYAHGLVRIAELGEVEAIEALAALISHCAHLRAEGSPGDGEAWAKTARRLGASVSGLQAPDPACERALTAHTRRVG